jgi:hypothetical protein
LAQLKTKMRTPVLVDGKTADDKAECAQAQRVASGAAGRTDIYTVRVNAADKAITCTLDNATSGEDTTHAVPVAQGDAVSVKLVSNNASDASADVTATLVLT